jgi:hypothetical protein
MRRLSKSKASGGISTAPWINTVRPLIFLLTEQRDEQAATRFLTKAIRRHGVPEKITIDICQVLHANRKPDF